MPSEMPSHWNIEGEVDAYMSKFWALFLMPIISVGLLILFMLIPKIDPLKKNFAKFKKYYHGARSAEHVLQGRWGPAQKKRQRSLRKVRKIAEEYYQGGYRGWHHDFASNIHKKPEFKDIPIQEIRKVVGEVAEPYGCKYGVKKQTVVI